MSSTAEYLTHFNGGRPYKVVIHSNDDVRIYQHTDNYEYEPIPIRVLQPRQIFIGTSPENQMTRFSSGYGHEFNGNSFLFILFNDVCVYVGKNIFSFRSKAPIISYTSPVGNNDCPYPYAVDADQRYYLIGEKVIMSNMSDEDTTDPYGCYYLKRSVIKYDAAGRRIAGFYTGNNPEHNLYYPTYRPFPDEEYDRFHSYDEIGDGLYLQYIDPLILKMDKETYHQLHVQHGVRENLEPLFLLQN